MTNVYPIFEWDPEVPIINDDENENESSDVMEQVAYDVHAEPDDEDTGKDDEREGHDDRYDNEDPKKLESHPDH